MGGGKGRGCDSLSLESQMPGVWEWGGKTPAFFADATEGALLSDQVGLTTCTRLHAKGQRWRKRGLKTDVPKGDRRFPTHAVSLKAGSMAGSVPCPR